MKPKDSPRRRRRLVKSAVAVTVGLGLVGWAGVAAAAPKPSNSAPPAARSQQEVALLTESATVFIAGEWSGYVQFPTRTGAQWSDQVKADFSCSGFIASSDGNVVTAGHCADPAEGKPALVDAFLQSQVDAGNITAADAQQFISEGAETQWPVEGQSAESAIALKMVVYQTAAASGIQVSNGLVATVIDNRPLAQGDVTLLKVTPSTPMPTLQVATEGPNVGDSVDAVGYPGSVSQVVDSNLEPTFAQGQVGANQQTSNGAPFTEVSAAMSPGMSGGPVVDNQGQVIGTVSFGPSDEKQQLNFAAGWNTIKSLLARNGVNNSPSTADTAYRTGMDDYFAGKYREAADQFTTVLNTEPSDALAQQYKSKAIGQEGSEPVATPASKNSGPPVWLWIVLGVVVLAVIGLGLMFLRKRGGSRPGSSPSYYGTPTYPNGGPPYGQPAPEGNWQYPAAPQTQYPTAPQQYAAPTPPQYQAPAVPAAPEYTGPASTAVLPPPHAAPPAPQPTDNQYGGWNPPPGGPNPPYQV